MTMNPFIEKHLDQIKNNVKAKIWQSSVQKMSSDIRLLQTSMTSLLNVLLELKFGQLSRERMEMILLHTSTIYNTWVNNVFFPFHALDVENVLQPARDIVNSTIQKFLASGGNLRYRAIMLGEIEKFTRSAIVWWNDLLFEISNVANGGSEFCEEIAFKMFGQRCRLCRTLSRNVNYDEEKEICDKCSRVCNHLTL